MTSIRRYNPIYIILGFLLNGYTVPLEGYDCKISSTSDSLCLELWTSLIIDKRVDDICIIEPFYLDELIAILNLLDRTTLYAICSNISKRNKK